MSKPRIKILFVSAHGRRCFFLELLSGRIPADRLYKPTETMQFFMDCSPSLRIFYEKDLIVNPSADYYTAAFRVPNN